MSWGAIGAFALALIVFFIFAQIWFHLVESLLQKIRNLFNRHSEPPAWHTLPADSEDKQDH